MPVWQGQDSLDPLVTVSSLSKASVGGIHTAISSGLATSANWPSANRAIYLPCRLSNAMLCAQLWWYNGTKTGSPNVDCGIYAVGPDGGGRLLASAGSTAQGTSSVLQAVNITDLLLAPGLYYLALSVSASNTGIFRLSHSVATCRAVGMAQEASALPLPATMTPVAITSGYMPMFGFTARSVL